jgi:LysR family nitrogen assimilation transcriptional regulator
MTTLHTEELVLISKTDPAFNQATDQPTNKATNKAQKTPKTQKCQSITLTEVAKLPLILPSRPNAFRILIEGEMNAIGRKPDITLEVDGLNAILSLVKEGMGHAILPGYTLSNFDNASPFSIKAIHSPAIKSQLMLVWSARRPTTQTQKKAMELVTQVLLHAIASAEPSA